MVSRQRLHQQKLRSEGRCVCCGRPAEPSTRKGAQGTSPHCLSHQIAARERQHRKHSSRRNTNAPSYKREAKLAEIVAQAPFEAPQWAKDGVEANPEAVIEVKAEEPDSFFYQIQGVDGR